MKAQTTTNINQSQNFKTDVEARYHLLDLVAKFETEVAIALQENAEWLEADREVIDYMNKGGLGKHPVTKKENIHFVYKGVKVCERGQIDKAIEQDSLDLNTLAHGKEEGVLLGK